MKFETAVQSQAKEEGTLRINKVAIGVRFDSSGRPGCDHGPDAYQHFDINITALRRCRSDIAGVSAEIRTTKCRVIPKHFPAYYVATRSYVASTCTVLLQTLLVGCCLLARYRSRRSVSVSQSVKRKKQDDENDTHPTLHVLLVPYA